MESENKKPNNPSAFPSEKDEYFEVGHSEVKNTIKDQGMTLRDYFAAKAMLGIMSNPDYGIFDGENKVHLPSIQQCYNIADTMLKQREL